MQIGFGIWMKASGHPHIFINSNGSFFCGHKAIPPVSTCRPNATCQLTLVLCEHCSARPMACFCIWSVMLLSLPLLLDGMLQTWAPGNALAINTGRNKTQYAYTYPRQLTRTLTVEFWGKGAGSARPEYSFYVSVAHPKDDNLIQVADWLYFMGRPIIEIKSAQSLAWTHFAITVDALGFPTVNFSFYVNSSLWKSASLDMASSALERLEENVLCVVLGAEQDKVLGGWDTSQILSGHIDEFRMWSGVRTAAQIQNTYRVGVPSDTPGLIMYYTFDDPLNSTCIRDQTDPSAARCMRLADHRDPRTNPVLSPQYVPAAAPFSQLTISTAPLCKASGEGQIRVEPVGSFGLRVRDLFCGAHNPRAIVTSVEGGVVKQQGRDVLGLPLDLDDELEYHSTGAASGGFVYRVQREDQQGTVSGRVTVLENRPPVLPADVLLDGTEDEELVWWIDVMDPENDIVTVQIVDAGDEDGGMAQVVPARLMELRFQPNLNVFGRNVSTFTIRARDHWGAYSNIMRVTISLKPATDAPILEIPTEFTMFRGQKVQFPFQVRDPDGGDPFVLASDSPKAYQV